MLKSMEKKIVFCTGDFDLVHIGHVQFLKRAKELGNCLVVCLNSDGVIRKKDSNRPIFNLEKRKEFIESLSFVDEVIVNEGNEAELLARYKPQFYVVGNPEYIPKEILNMLKDNNCDLKIIDTPKVSSDSIIRRRLESVDWTVAEYLQKIKKTFSFEELENTLEKIKNLKVLVIGDCIIDEYYFICPKGRAVKDPIMSVDYGYQERYAGGALAIANHAACFCDSIKIITLLGDSKRNEGFIRKSLKQNVELKTFTKKNSPTTVKRRFIDKDRNIKLFKIEYINDSVIDERLEKEIIQCLESELEKYDIVLVGDFGHGFITGDVMRLLEGKSAYLAVNIQTNSANFGYNYFIKCANADFMSIAENEARLALQARFSEIDSVVSAIKSRGYNHFLITMGNKGNVYVDKSVTKAPALTASVKDTVGAGDAVFSISSMMAYAQYNEHLLPFIANCIGGIAVNITGNKESVNKEKLMDFIKNILG